MSFPPTLPTTLTNFRTQRAGELDSPVPNVIRHRDPRDAGMLGLAASALRREFLGGNLSQITERLRLRSDGTPLERDIWSDDFMEENPLFKGREELLVGVRTNEELEALTRQVQTELSDEAELARSGALGTMARLAAGVVSPENLLPLGIALSGARRVGAAFRSGASAGTIGAALGEAGLQATQAERDAMGSAITVGVAPIIGGAMGAGFYGASKIGRHAIERGMDLSINGAVKEAARVSQDYLVKLEESDFLPSARSEVARIGREARRVLRDVELGDLKARTSQIRDDILSAYEEGRARGTTRETPPREPAPFGEEQIRARATEVDPEITVTIGGTGRVRDNDTTVSAVYHPDRHEIIIDEARIRQTFEERPWENPQVEGVEPLDGELFETADDWVEFHIEHELLHAQRTRAGQNLPDVAAEENEINRLAVAKMREMRGMENARAEFKEVMQEEAATYEGAANRAQEARASAEQRAEEAERALEGLEEERANAVGESDEAAERFEEQREALSAARDEAQAEAELVGREEELLRLRTQATRALAAEAQESTGDFSPIGQRFETYFRRAQSAGNEESAIRWWRALVEVDPARARKLVAELEKQRKLLEGAARSDAREQVEEVVGEEAQLPALPGGATRVRPPREGIPATDEPPTLLTKKDSWIVTNDGELITARSQGMGPSSSHMAITLRAGVDPEDVAETGWGPAKPPGAEDLGPQSVEAAEADLVALRDGKGILARLGDNQGIDEEMETFLEILEKSTGAAQARAARAVLEARRDAAVAGREAPEPETTPTSDLEPDLPALPGGATQVAPPRERIQPTDEIAPEELAPADEALTLITENDSWIVLNDGTLITARSLGLDPGVAHLAIARTAGVDLDEVANSGTGLGRQTGTGLGRQAAEPEAPPGPAPRVTESQDGTTTYNFEDGTEVTISGGSHLEMIEVPESARRQGAATRHIREIEELTGRKIETGTAGSDEGLALMKKLGIQDVTERPTTPEAKRAPSGPPETPAEREELQKELDDWKQTAEAISARMEDLEEKVENDTITAKESEEYGRLNSELDGVSGLIDDLTLRLDDLARARDAKIRAENRGRPSGAERGSEFQAREEIIGEINEQYLARTPEGRREQFRVVDEEPEEIDLAGYVDRTAAQRTVAVDTERIPTPQPLSLQDQRRIGRIERIEEGIPVRFLSLFGMEDFTASAGKFQNAMVGVEGTDTIGSVVTYVRSRDTFEVSTQDGVQHFPASKLRVLVDQGGNIEYRDQTLSTREEHPQMMPPRFEDRTQAQKSLEVAERNVKQRRLALVNAEKDPGRVDDVPKLRAQLQQAEEEIFLLRRREEQRPDKENIETRDELERQRSEAEAKQSGRVWGRRKAKEKLIERIRKSQRNIVEARKSLEAAGNDAEFRDRYASLRQMHDDLQRTLLELEGGSQGARAVEIKIADTIRQTHELNRQRKAATSGGSRSAIAGSERHIREMETELVTIERELRGREERDVRLGDPAFLARQTEGPDLDQLRARLEAETTTRPEVTRTETTGPKGGKRVVWEFDGKTYRLKKEAVAAQKEWKPDVEERLEQARIDEAIPLDRYQQDQDALETLARMLTGMPGEIKSVAREFAEEIGDAPREVWLMRLVDRIDDELDGVANAQRILLDPDDVEDFAAAFNVRESTVRELGEGPEVEGLRIIGPKESPFAPPSGAIDPGIIAPDKIMDILGLSEAQMRTLMRHNPKMRLLLSRHPASRQLAELLTNLGAIRMEGNVRGERAQAVSVEDRVMVDWQSGLIELLRDLPRNYLKALDELRGRTRDRDKAGLLSTTFTALGEAVRERAGREAFSYTAYHLRLAKALRNGDVDQPPVGEPRLEAVSQMAKKIRSTAFGPALKEMEELGWVDKGLRPRFAQSYMTRVWDNAQLRDRQDEWIDLATQAIIKEQGLDPTKAAKRADDIYESIINSVDGRLDPMALGPRGTRQSKERVIPGTDDFWSEHGFLVDNVETILRIWYRTLPPDIELAKLDRLLAGPLANNRNYRADPQLRSGLDRTYAAMRRRIGNAPVEDQPALMRQMKSDQRDLEAIVELLRHTYGMPRDGDGAFDKIRKGARSFSRTIRPYNYLTDSGQFWMSAIPDTARPLMVMGITRTFGTGLAPLIRIWQQI